MDIKIYDYPKARRGIHDLCICPMGRYGTKIHRIPNSANNSKSSSANLSKSYDDGHDEVDQGTIESSVIPLQKSSSAQSETFADLSFVPLSDNQSTPKSSPESSPKSSQDDISPKRINISLKRDYVPESAREANSECCYLSLLFIVLAVLTSFYVYSSAGSTLNKVYYDETNYKQDLHELMKLYDIEYDNMLNIYSGVTSIVSDNDASSFVFIYNKNSESSDVLSFLRALATVTAKLLRNETEHAFPVTATSVELNAKTERDIIFDYHSKLNESGVLMVDDLERVEPLKMRSFHYYSDRENPYVRKSALFFALNLNACGNGINRSKYQVVESCLSSMWRDLPDHTRLPLIARICNIVIDLSQNAPR